MRHLGSLLIASLLPLASACALEEGELPLEEETLTLEEGAVEAASVDEQDSVSATWSRCERSLVTVTAYKAPTGSAAWGTYGAGLTFAYMGEANGRFQNWWGPGDPFPGKGSAFINLSQTVTVACPW